MIMSIYQCHCALHFFSCDACCLFSCIYEMFCCLVTLIPLTVASTVPTKLPGIRLVIVDPTLNGANWLTSRVSFSRSNMNKNDGACETITHIVCLRPCDLLPFKIHNIHNSWLCNRIGDTGRQCRFNTCRWEGVTSENALFMDLIGAFVKKKINVGSHRQLGIGRSTEYYFKGRWQRVDQYC